MSHSTVYDDDILLWSEQQAEIIRRLAKTRRDLPKEFDVENVAEEIESVGRSELAAVESQLQNILVHLMKMAVEPNAGALRHWNVERIAFHARRYVPSMRQRIDFDQLWALARELSVLGADQPEAVGAVLPLLPPFPLDALLAERVDLVALVRTIDQAVATQE
jgi:hypothetical protein